MKLKSISPDGRHGVAEDGMAVVCVDATEICGGCYMLEPGTDRCFDKNQEYRIRSDYVDNNRCRPEDRLCIWVSCLG